MTEQSQTSNDEVVLDFLGTPIKIGETIIYPSMVGRSPRLTLAEVLSVKSTEGYYKHSIRVQPIADSNSSYRFKDFKYDAKTRKGEFVDKQAKPVTLHFADRIMVIT